MQEYECVCVFKAVFLLQEEEEEEEKQENEYLELLMEEWKCISSDGKARLDSLRALKEA